VKPPRFTYHDPATIADATALLARHGAEARVLAGGQSLVPMLNFRLVRPQHVVDINGVSGLDHVSASAGGLRLGAMVRQRAIERSALIRERCPLLAEAIVQVGHPQIRNRGTIGGSLVHADPAAELPGVMVALDATMVLERAGARRTLAAADFFRATLTTALEPEEMLIEIGIPAAPDGAGFAFEELALRQGDFALAGVAVVLGVARDGTVAHARVVVIGVESRPARVEAAEQSLVGARPAAAAFAEARRLVGAHLHAEDDLHATAAYRKRLAGVLAERALARAAGMAEARVA
jgi:aerobic carbon-monoxide dehydrogenase medium subunit